jgi:hypothetical protein
MRYAIAMATGPSHFHARLGRQPCLALSNGGTNSDSFLKRERAARSCRNADPCGPSSELMIRGRAGSALC